MGLYFCGILDPAAVQDCITSSHLIAYVRVQLVNDIINSTEYVTTVMKNVLNNKKVVETLRFALQKKIWKRDYKSVFDYRLKSNKHTHMFLFVTQAVLGFSCTNIIFFGWKSRFI